MRCVLVYVSSSCLLNPDFSLSVSLTTTSIRLPILPPLSSLRPLSSSLIYLTDGSFLHSPSTSSLVSLASTEICIVIASPAERTARHWVHPVSFRFVPPPRYSIFVSRVPLRPFYVYRAIYFRDVYSVLLFCLLLLTPNGYPTLVSHMTPPQLSPVCLSRSVDNTNTRYAQLRVGCGRCGGSTPHENLLDTIGRGLGWYSTDRRRGRGDTPHSEVGPGQGAG